MEGLPKGTYQKRAAFEEEVPSKAIERVKPSSEESNRMDAAVSRVSELLENANVSWHFDGALCISLAKGEYIRKHTDIDVSIEESDLEKCAERIAQFGYGMFLVYPDEENTAQERTFERVSGPKMLENRKGELMICAVDDQGAIRDSEEFDANFIDVHAIVRDAGHRPIAHGVELPAAWFEGRAARYKGQLVYLSHPAKIAYFKLHESRAQDLNDLKDLVQNGELSLKDVEDIERAIDSGGFVAKMVSDLRTSRIKNAKQLRAWVEDEVGSKTDL